MTPINFTANSVSILATTIKGGAGATTSVFTAQMMLSSTLLLDDSIFGGTGADTLLFTGSVG